MTREKTWESCALRLFCGHRWQNNIDAKQVDLDSRAEREMRHLDERARFPAVTVLE